MEITIKNNKLNYEILKKNGQYFKMDPVKWTR